MSIAQRASALMHGVLTICALVVTGLVVRREFSPPASAHSESAEPMRIEGWRRIGAEGHRLGSTDAPVQIVVFSDFQCPACRVLASHLDSIRAEQPGRVALVHRHSPLRSHAHAVAAARASECAARQGAFRAYHDALFAEQAAIGVWPWERFARTAGVRDLSTFTRCVRAPGSMARLDRDTAAAGELRVEGTPTFLVNDIKYVGAPPLETLRAYVRRAEQASLGG